ncbi:MAG TPA: ABC transporter substrate-binding protein [Gammaproteobacteria bacterium]|nr:ABC transporter substrate-binding protein [Gammaproteobacteria bacterium]
MKKSRLVLAALGLSAAVTFGAAHAATISISCGAVGQELQLCKEGADAWAKKTGNDVKVVSTPNSSTERLALYQQILSAGADDIDVFQIDVIWPGILANHFIDLKPYAKDRTKGFFQAIIKNNTVDGRLVAMPWFTDAGVLYYRKDLLEKYNEKVPTTWAEMEKTAAKIQKAERDAGNQKMWGYVFQGRAYEGLTCDALEWVASHNGGTIVAPDGKITIDNENAATALDQAAGWIGKISPEGALNYAEEEARGVFQTGNAVFMRNWPYAWSLAQSEKSSIKGKVGVAALPKGGADGRHAAALGGWQLAVSKYSKHPKLAADLVMYLTSYDEQKRRAIKASYNPTIKALYKDKEVLKAVPFFGDLYETFVNAVPRPSTVTGSNYNKVSNAFYNAVHDVLQGNAKAMPRLKQLKGQLMRISHGGRW